MWKIQILNLTAAIAILSFTASADPFIPYPNIGTEAPAHSFVAATTGDVTAYFFGSDASYSSTVAVQIGMSVNGFLLPNHATLYGTAAVLGSANQGDVLTFHLRVRPNGESNAAGEYFLFSNPALNSDGKNHVYTTPFSVGQNTGLPLIPAGTYMGWEDLVNLGDVDYNDHQFVITNTNVPDGGVTLILLGGALVGLETLRRRFRA